LNAFAGRVPTSSRYQYSGAIFVLMILACLLAGSRPRRNWLIAGAIAAVLAIGPNIVVLHEASKSYKREATLTRADTAAIEIAKNSVDPLFELTPENAGTGALVNVYAAQYLEAVEEFGSPAYSQAELEAAPPEARRQADIVLADALPIEAENKPGFDQGGGRENCVETGAGASEEVQLQPGLTRIEVPPGDAQVGLGLRRFAEGEFPVGLPAAAGGTTTIVKIPRDTSSRPWYLQAASEDPVRVCR
jgi:hypothetical protein